MKHGIPTMTVLATALLARAVTCYLPRGRTCHDCTCSLWLYSLLRPYLDSVAGTTSATSTTWSRRSAASARGSSMRRRIMSRPSRPLCAYIDPRRGHDFPVCKEHVLATGLFAQINACLIYIYYERYDVQTTNGYGLVLYLSIEGFMNVELGGAGGGRQPARGTKKRGHGADPQCAQKSHPRPCLSPSLGSALVKPRAVKPRAEHG